MFGLNTNQDTAQGPSPAAAALPFLFGPMLRDSADVPELEVEDPSLEELEEATEALDFEPFVSDAELEGSHFEDSIRMWLRRIGRTPLLTPEQELELARLSE